MKTFDNGDTKENLSTIRIARSYQKTVRPGEFESESPFSSATVELPYGTPYAVELLERACIQFDNVLDVSEELVAYGFMGKEFFNVRLKPSCDILAKRMREVKNQMDNYEDNHKELAHVAFKRGQDRLKAYKELND